MIAVYNFKAPLKLLVCDENMTHGVFALLDSGNRVVDVGESA